MKRYFEVELEYTGTKTFRVEVDRHHSISDTLEYIAANLYRLEQDHNPHSDGVESTLTAIYLREDK
jgi:hypothetical protein